jgi:hypothetical protein
VCEKITNDAREEIRFARQELDKERAHRREKVWKIFSWAATLLVAITGGVIALKFKPSAQIEYCWWLKGVLSASSVILAGFASLWIHQNLKILRDTETAIAKCDEVLDITNVIPSKEPRFGYIEALALLATATIIAILVKF